MHILNEKYDKVVCINLASRKDKRDKMQEKFDKLGIDVEWYTAVKYGFAPRLVNIINRNKIGKFNVNQPFELGAALSHYAVIKTALEQGHKNIFVFEDDVLFHEDFNNQVVKAFNKLPDDYDFMMFYSFMYKIQEENYKINSRWMRAYDSWSLVAYGAEKEYMKRYINKQDSSLKVADLVTYEMQREPEFKQYVTAPTLVIPDVEQGSDIRTLMNYENNPNILNLGVKNNYI